MAFRKTAIVCGNRFLIKLDDNESKVKAYCLEPHDLVVAKLADGRDKDKVFIRALLRIYTFYQMINYDAELIKITDLMTEFNAANITYVLNKIYIADPTQYNALLKNIEKKPENS